MSDPTVKLVFKASNDTYLSLILRSKGIYNLEAGKRDIDDWCEFSVEPQSATSIALRGHNGKYLSLILEKKGGPYVVHASKDQIDDWCIFQVEKSPDEQINENSIALKGLNGKYLSAILRSGGIYTIEASKSSIDNWCQFKTMTILC
ncbi:hypothetical protein LF934_20290 [Dickeya dadantii]|uniref:fascin domain-containing protein n=1 Tax=Dickeya dadantii TaxID=204038 RepID=UPI001C0D9D43|nr:hypothetical protein [Dickeya dadantii]MCA7014973.1 hypothetical protein [Dickeya dadantii]QWT40331.1 hypothetical protein KNV89_18660 [Dickeya dadantii]